MRAFIAWVACLVVAAGLIACSLVACAPSIDGSTPCSRADGLLQSCGVLLPVLEGSTCTGMAQQIATCVNVTNGSCDALAQLGSHLQSCVDTDAGSLPTDFPQVLADGSARQDGMTTDGGAPSSPFDAGLSSDASDEDEMSPDDAAPPSPTSPDADVADASASSDAADLEDSASPLGSSFDVSAVIASDESQSYATNRLGAGDYLFSLSTSGEVEVYIRKGFAPTELDFDCVITDPSETCDETIASSAILHVLVVGVATSSSFDLTAAAQP